MTELQKLRIKYEFAVGLEKFLLRKSMEAQIEATAAGQQATNLARELKTLQENK